MKLIKCCVLQADLFSKKNYRDSSKLSEYKEIETFKIIVYMRDIRSLMESKIIAQAFKKICN